MERPESPRRLTTIPSLSWDDCRLLVDTVTDYAIFMLDPDGRVATWNAGAEKIKGYTAQEIVGKHFSVFFPHDDVEAGNPERELAVARGVGRFEDENWRVRKDGSRFWANVIITALRDESGNLRGFGKVTRDLTKRRAAEEQLRQAEEKFHYLVDAITDYAVFMLDPTGHVATWNAGAQKTKGYTAEEIIGKHFSVFYAPEDRAAGKPQRILDAVRRDGRFEDEGWRARKDGTLFWANVVITALRDAQGEVTGFAKVTRDLTERRQAEEAERNAIVERRAAERAEEAARRAEEANRVKDDFLATVSHELRTPLNAILGWATLLRARPFEPEGTAKALEVIHRNAEAQARIIEDILDVSRIITGKLRLDVKPMDLASIVRDAIEVVRPSIDAKRITLKVDVPPEPTLLVGDPERLRQVVWNLLSNAVKFTDADGAMTITVGHEGSKVFVQVDDTGRGIEPSFLPYVFERFRQADSSTTRRLGGLGLGLAIVRHIVELHGGRAYAESRGQGQGATFRVVLPVRAVKSERTNPPPLDADPHPPAADHGVSLGGVRVLVVDDDADARELLREALLEAGATVDVADSASSGFDVLERVHPDVLVSDIGMPEEDGYTFIRRVRALGPTKGGAIPAIALTAYTRSQDRTRALAAGFTSHVGKPVDTADLVAAVANLAALVRR